MRKLRYLFLDKNEIRFIPSKLFWRLESLTHLTLTNNQIPYFENSTFRNVLNILYLNIGMDKLRHIENGTFSTLLSLKQLDISDNVLASVEASELSRLNNLVLIDLRKNKIICTCNYIALLKSIKATHVRSDCIDSFVKTLVKICNGSSLIFSNQKKEDDFTVISTQGRYMYPYLDCKSLFCMNIIYEHDDMLVNL